MKKLLSIICAVATFAAAAFSLSACGGTAEVIYTLSEDGTHYIVSGVSGNLGALKEYEVLAQYSPEGGEAKPVTEIGEEAFMGCYASYSIILPESITAIGARAFMNCGFRNFTIPESVERIEQGAFGRCTSLESIVIPQSVTYLGDYAFAYCSSLQSAVVNADITDLGFCTFANSYTNSAGNLYMSTSLISVTLPASLQKISITALDGNLIEDIYFKGSEEEWNALYFYTYDLKEGSEEEYEEKVVEKDKVLASSIKVHFGGAES